MSETFSFAAVVRATVKHYRVFATVVGIMLFLALIYMHVAPVEFEATMIVAPPPSSLADEAANGSGLGSGLVSSLIGGTGQVPRDFAEFTSLTSSDFLAQKLLADDRVKAGIYPTIWDARARRWKEPTGVVAFLKQTLRLLFGIPAWHPPTPRDLSDYLGKEIKVVDVPRSDLYRISYSNKDPQFAAFLLGTIYSVLDRDLKVRFLRRHAANLAYIERVLDKMSSVELRSAMSLLYVQEQRRMMLASSALPFSADMVDEPTPTAVPLAPNPAIVYGAALVLGLVFGVFFAVFYESRPRAASDTVWKTVRRKIPGLREATRAG